jgi:PhoPQ-activated pathogenicity-related protein
VLPFSWQDLIDAFQYRARLSMPKLVVTTSQDEFFLIDDA